MQTTARCVETVDDAMVDRAAEAWARRPLREADEAVGRRGRSMDGRRRPPQPAAALQILLAGRPAGLCRWLHSQRGAVHDDLVSRMGVPRGHSALAVFHTAAEAPGCSGFRSSSGHRSSGRSPRCSASIIAIWMYSPRKRYRYAGAPTSIPYRGWKRWHTIIGLFFGVVTMTWAFSGLLSMGPFPITDRLTELTVPAPPAPEGAQAGRGGRGGAGRGPNLGAALRGTWRRERVQLRGKGRSRGARLGS